MKTSMLFASCLLCALSASAHPSDVADGKTDGAKTEASSSNPKEESPRKTSRLRIGGYGEAVYSRNFYSDNVYRYTRPGDYKNDPSHGRFDIPHAVIYLSYDFGKGWKVSTEIEFEHGGSGGSHEQEFEEAGEWEQEVEKGGEVELEQFWIEKSFCDAFNIRAGHIIVPVGLTNAYHEPLNFFTVYRPEGEATIFPCTWHETGVSLWGRARDWRYEVQMTAGLDAFLFSRDNWIQNGNHSTFEFKVANKYAVAARVDNYSVKGLRMGLSGYYGYSMHNTQPHDQEGAGKPYDKVKGEVLIGAFDFTYNDHNWIVRGNADYGYLGDAAEITRAKRGVSSNNSPYDKTSVGKNAVAIGIEAGYDLFSQWHKLKDKEQKLYVFGRYDYYDSCIPEATQTRYDYTRRQCMTFGFNYHPIEQIVVKGQFAKRFFTHAYNDEPSVSLGIAYMGFFL